MGTNPDRETRFRFKQFSVSDAVGAMKVGTDGVLIGAWAPVDNVSTALDVGTGTGLIALMLAQRGVASITALEINPDAAAEAQQNVNDSPWSEKIKILCADFSEYSADAPFDLIVSNPPFFSSTLKSPDAARCAARHESGLSFKSLIEFAAANLAPDGRLAFISPADKEADIVFDATMAKLHILKRTFVKSSPTHNAKRILWLLGKMPDECSGDTLLIRDASGNFSGDYINLTSDFYLHL